MTIYNTNPMEGQLDLTLHNLGKTLQSLNNHLENLRPVEKTLHGEDRLQAKQEYAKRHGDDMFGELAIAGFNSIAGLDVLEALTNMSGGFGEILMEAGQDLHELDGKNNMTVLEKALVLRRQRAYEEELRQERRREKESRHLKNMMTLMAMAVATLEERVKRREKREAKRHTLDSFKQNNQSIAKKKMTAVKRNILTMNTKDIVVEAA